MTEPVSPPSALFGPDGTQLPDPTPVLSDPLVAPFTAAPGGPGQDTSSVSLPAVPGARALQEAMAAVFAAGMLAEEESVDAAPPAHLEPARPAGGSAPAGEFPAQLQPPGPMGRPPPPGPAATRPFHLPGAGPPRVLPPARPAGLSRRADRDVPIRQPSARWNSSVQTGIIIALIIFGLVVFNIIKEIIELLF